MSTNQKASDTFLRGYSCSQAVLSARCGRYGLDQKTAIAIATGFGGGIARTGNTCGAVTGAIAIIGLHAGSEKPGDREAKENTYKIVREFIAEFEKEFGSTNCVELIGCHIGTDAGHAKARKNGIFENVCPRFVDGAVNILDQILVIQEDKQPSHN